VESTASVTSAAMKPAAAAKAATSLKATASKTATVYASTPKTAAAGITKTTASVITPSVVTASVVAASVETASIVTPAVVAVEPGAGADKDAADEVIGAVEAVRRAFVRIIIIVAVSAYRCWADIAVPWADANANNHSLCVRERC
jgi:hypothetical protein